MAGDDGTVTVDVDRNVFSRLNANREVDSN